MALTSQERFEVRAGIARALSNKREPCDLTKADWIVAADAVDDWLELNLPALNAAIPGAIRNAMTPSQKLLLVKHILDKRFSNG